MVVAAARLSTTIEAAAVVVVGGGAPAAAAAAASTATWAGGGALATALVDCHTLGRNRRPPLVRTMGCRSGRLKGRRRAQARATTMRKVTKKMRRGGGGGGGGGGGLFKEEDGMRKGLVQSRKTKGFYAGAKFGAGGSLLCIIPSCSTLLGIKLTCRINKVGN